jgi:hypothetical protein
MTTTTPQRDQMIKRAVMHRPETVADVSIHLWEKLAHELISIIGEGGFQSLYKRSTHLTSEVFPWIIAAQPVRHADARFTDLKTSLEGRGSAEAGEASTALLITFIDILALLIGELLTASILRSAWGDDALDTVAKELP